MATVQRLARLALTRLDAPYSVTWNELQSTALPRRLSVLRTPVLATTRSHFGPWHTSSPLSINPRTTRTRKHDLTAKSRTSFWLGHQHYMYPPAVCNIHRRWLTCGHADW